MTLLPQQQSARWWMPYLQEKSAFTCSNSVVVTLSISLCKNNTLDPTLINGRIVVCTLEAVTDNRREKAAFVRQAGGVGMILIDPLVKDVGFQFVIPGTQVDQENALELQAYMTTEK